MLSTPNGCICKHIKGKCHSCQSREKSKNKCTACGIGLLSQIEETRSICCACYWGPKLEPKQLWTDAEMALPPNEVIDEDDSYDVDLAAIDALAQSFGV